MEANVNVPINFIVASNGYLELFFKTVDKSFV